MKSGNGERVVVIIYHDGMPFDVGTETCRYDFHFSEKLGLLWKLSGGGSHAKSGFYLNRYRDPSPPKAQIWTEAGIPLTSDDGSNRVLTEDEVLDRGYERLSAPLGENPFEIGCEGSVRYCDACRDWVDADLDRPCRHLRWSDHVGELVRRGGLPPLPAINMRAGPKGVLP